MCIRLDILSTNQFYIWHSNRNRNVLIEYISRQKFTVNLEKWSGTRLPKLNWLTQRIHKRKTDILITMRWFMGGFGYLCVANANANNNSNINNIRRKTFLSSKRFKSRIQLVKLTAPATITTTIISSIILDVPLIEFSMFCSTTFETNLLIKL